jgi:hypothetical protein
MQLFEGLLLLLSGSRPQLAGLCESLLVGETFVLFLESLGRSSVEIDVGADDLRRLALLLDVLLFVLLTIRRFLVLLISLLSSLSYIIITKSLKVDSNSIMRLNHILDSNIYLHSSLPVDLDLDVLPPLPAPFLAEAPCLPLEADLLFFLPEGDLDLEAALILPALAVAAPPALIF